MNNKSFNENLPLINKRILSLINEKCNGNVAKFARELGLEKSQKINRLFKIDKRNNEYPTPSFDVLKLISDKFNLPIDSFIEKKEDNKTINNITIESNRINGNDNVLGNNNTIEENNNDYLEIIRKQQEQIDKLIFLLSEKKL